MSVVVDYWLKEISESLQPAKVALQKAQEKTAESDLMDYFEASLEFKYQEGELVEYEGEEYIVDERLLTPSWLGDTRDRRYSIKADEYTNNTITVSEDEII